MSLTVLAKLLIGAPIVCILCVVIGIYSTAWLDTWNLQHLYDHAISNLGTTWSSYRFLFAIGFTASSTIIIAAGMIKIYLISALWKLSVSLVLNMLLMSIGAIMLIVMAWAPFDVDWPLHMTGAVAGIAVALIAQLLDTIHWFHFCKFMEAVDTRLYILMAYSLVCLFTSAGFFMAWVGSSLATYADPNGTVGVNGQEPWCEWVGLLFAILGFLAQSAHGVCILVHVRNRDPSREGLIHDEEREGLLNKHERGQRGMRRVHL